MTHHELRAKCHEQIALVGESAMITLVIPGRWGKTATKRLWPGGPTGEIVSEQMCGGKACVVVFAKAREVLAALDRMAP
jgi:hypothetical protein